MCITLYKKGKSFCVLRDKEGRQYGWKVFRRWCGGDYAGEFCGVNTPRPRGKWLKAKDFTPVSRFRDMPNAAVIEGYEPGWHVFRTRVDARAWRAWSVVKVLVRKVREKGSVGVGHACFVADEIFIPK